MKRNSRSDNESTLQFNNDKKSFENEIRVLNDTLRSKIGELDRNHELINDYKIQLDKSEKFNEDLRERQNEISATNNGLEREKDFLNHNLKVFF